MNCSSHAVIGGHYWTPSNATNPWNSAAAKYFVTPLGKKGKRYEANGNFSVANGYSYEENLGHAVVVHQYNGGRIACGVLA
jgi:hypothetical protein